MTILDTIRSKMQERYRINPKVHICVPMNRSKVSIDNQEAIIKGVYRNIFQIETDGSLYTFQYSDIVTKTITIKELDWKQCDVTVS